MENPPEEFEERRNAKRTPFSAQTTIYIDMDSYLVEAIDLSFKGIGLRGIENLDLKEGDRVSVDWGTGVEIDSVVAWAGESIAGLFFVHELEPDHALLKDINEPPTTTNK